MAESRISGEELRDLPLFTVLMDSYGQGNPVILAPAQVIRSTGRAVELLWIDSGRRRSLEGAIWDGHYYTVVSRPDGLAKAWDEGFAAGREEAFYAPVPTNPYWEP